MKKIITIILLFLSACTMTQIEIRETKRIFPLGSFVEFQDNFEGVKIKTRGKVDGYNKDGTVRLLVPTRYLSSSGKLMRSDSLIGVMNIKTYELMPVK